MSEIILAVRVGQIRLIFLKVAIQRQCTAGSLFHVIRYFSCYSQKICLLQHLPFISTCHLSMQWLMKPWWRVEDVFFYQSISLLCSEVWLSFFVAAAVQEEMYTQYLTWFPSLLTLPHIIQSGYIGRNMYVPSVAACFLLVGNF